MCVGNIFDSILTLFFCYIVSIYAFSIDDESYFFVGGAH